MTPKSKWINSPSCIFFFFFLQRYQNIKEKNNSSNLQASTSSKHWQQKCTGWVSGLEISPRSESHMGALRLCSRANQRNLPFSKSVSLTLHTSASCPTFLFSVVCFLFLFFLFSCASRLNPGTSSVHRRSQLVLWQPWYDGHTDKILAYACESSSSTPWLTVSRYRLTYGAVGVALKKRVLLTILAGSYCFLCSLRGTLFLLFTTSWAPSGLIDNVIDLLFHFFFLDKVVELYIGK